MPKLCANCGKNRGESKWPIYSRYNVSVKLTRTTYKKSRFFVPVCTTCKTLLEGDKSRWLNIIWVSAIGTFVFLGLTIFLYQYARFFLTISMMALGVSIYAYIHRTRYWRHSGIGSYDGRYFKFNNPNFFKRFSKRNPAMVDKDLE